MKNFLSFLCHPIIEAKARYYANYILPTEKFIWLIDHDKKKAHDVYWFYKHHKHFPWKNPITLNEKIIWLSVMTDTTKWTEYADKYAVRQHVTEVLGDGLLTKFSECGSMLMI